tara:strand:+ start:6170 stop:7225 length:1056 start_codon:yes stop_codon:yes gene_type:complete
MIPLAAPIIGKEERDAIARVIESGQLVQGKEVEAFELEFSEIFDGLHCVALNSGTSSLHLGLLASGVGKGDEVIIPSFTFAATANAVSLTGATPVFADIDPDTFCISVKSIESCISKRTAGVMPVHLFGHPADMTGIRELASQHGILVFEDAAQAHLASLDGKLVGTFGDFAAFSFYPSKNMTTGEGGMLVTKHAETARKVKLLRNQGMDVPYQNEIVGFNNRMTEISAAMGRAQLRKLPKFNRARIANAEIFNSRLLGVVTPVVVEGANHVYHQYTVRTDNRAGLEERLSERGIGFGVYYKTPVHMFPSFNQMLDLPETEKAAEEVISLPVHPSLTEVQIDEIVEVVSNE